MRRAIALVLLVLGACTQAPAGPSYRYGAGSGSVRLAAGAEHDELDFTDVTGSYTGSRRFTVLLAAAPTTLEATVRNPQGRALYHASQIGITLAYQNRKLTLDDGGVCTLQLLRAEREGAEGSITCVGLGTHSGKGYDVQAAFRLVAGPA